MPLMVLRDDSTWWAIIFGLLGLLLASDVECAFLLLALLESETSSF